MGYTSQTQHKLSCSWYRCPEIGTSSIDWAQLSRFYLKTETETSLRIVVLKYSYKQDGVSDKNRTIDNVQKHNICVNISSSQTFRSYLMLFVWNALFFHLLLGVPSSLFRSSTSINFLAVSYVLRAHQSHFLWFFSLIVLFFKEYILFVMRFSPASCKCHINRSEYIPQHLVFP
jgi:hypothetical protein